MPLLLLAPSAEIPFSGSQVGQETSVLKVQNLTDSYVAFKVKTTAQKTYLVSPSNGILPPGEKCDVQILVQPSKQIDVADRFQVLATKASGAGRDLEVGPGDEPPQRGRAGRRRGLLGPGAVRPAQDVRAGPRGRSAQGRRRSELCEEPEQGRAAWLRLPRS